MGWFHTHNPATNGRDHASVAEVLACFRDEKSLLFRLALLITGNEAAAEQSVVNACEMTVQGHSPFRDWLTEWAKSATLTSAISRCTNAIRGCEATYRHERCTHAEHMSWSDDAERAHTLSVLLAADPTVVIAQLDALSRAALILRLATRSSIQDCVVRLNVSRAAVLAANCRAMTWLGGLHCKVSSASPDATGPQTPSHADPSQREL